MGGLERRLHNLELQLRSPVPLEDTDLPIEKWVDELLTNSSGPALYGIEEDEWARFNSWIEMLGSYLPCQLG